ncbi:hypothetical protein [Alistipes sp.]|uniref:hypothetical protein n=1 Tax=Alistipes sp. TaxID=1872444 RepID=UPI003AF117C3
MKTSLAIFTAVLTTLCSVSTALGQTPPPASGDAPQPAIPNMPQLYYSVTRDPIVAPWIIKNPKSIRIKVGESAYFSLNFSGHPIPTVYCTHDNRPINFKAVLPDSNILKFESYSDAGSYGLLIRDATIKDSGYYQFSVENEGGVAVAVASLNVTNGDVTRKLP